MTNNTNIKKLNNTLNNTHNVDPKNQHIIDYDKRDTKGRTPLHNAVLEKDYDKVVWLISKGADINARMPCNETPLFYAIEKNNVEMVHLLLRKGANWRNGLYKPGIVVAMENESQAIIGLLLAHGESIDTIFLNYDPTPSSARAKIKLFPKQYQENIKEICKKHSKFIKRLKVLANHCNYLSAIKNELPGKMVEEMQLLLEHALLKSENTPVFDLTAFINQYKNYSISRKHIQKIGFVQTLAYFGHDNLLESLINHGVDIQKQNSDGKKPLDYAIAKNKKSVIALLKKTLIDIEHSRQVMLSELLSNQLLKSYPNNVSINNVNEKGQNLLEEIVNKHSNKLTSQTIWKIKKQLCHRGFHLTETDKKANYHLSEEASFLEAYEQRAYAELYHAAKTSQDIPAILNKYSIPMNLKDNEGITVLYLMIVESNKIAVNHLLGNGALINDSFTSTKITALHCACLVNRVDILKMLLEHPTMTEEIINRKTQDHNTAIHFAIRYGYEDCVNLLIKHKANIHLSSLEGTALEIALKYKKVAIAQKLIFLGSDINRVKINHPLIEKLKKERETILYELRNDNDLVKSCIFEMHKKGFDIAFKNFSATYSEPKSILSIKIQKIPSPDNRILVTIIQSHPTLQKTIIYKKEYSLAEFNSDNSNEVLKITLPGFSKADIQINSKGDLLFKGVQTNSDIRVQTFGSCVFEQFTTIRGVYCKSLQFLNKADFQANHLTVRKLAGKKADQTFINQGNISIKKLFDVSGGVLKNQKASINAKSSKIKYYVLLNDYGTIQTIKLNKLTGLSLPKIRNNQANISSVQSNVLIENDFDANYFKKDIHFTGELHNINGGRIYSIAKKVLIKGTKLICDDNSFIYGKLKTWLNIKDLSTSTKAKLYFARPLVGNAVGIKTDSKPILHSVTASKNLYLNCSENNLKYRNQIPLISEGTISIKVPALINLSIIYGQKGGSIDTTAVNGSYSISNYSKIICRKGDWKFNGKGFYYDGKSLLAIRGSFLFNVENLSIQKPIFAGKNISARISSLDYKKDVFRSLGNLEFIFNKPCNVTTELSNYGTIIIDNSSAKGVMHLLANIMTASMPESYEKLNGQINKDRQQQGDIIIRANNKDVQVGTDDIFVEIEACGKAEIDSNRFNLHNGMFAGNNGCHVKANKEIHLGRAVSPHEMPCGLASGNNAIIESSQSSIHLNHLELLCNKNIEFRAPIFMQNTSSHFYIGADAHFNTPLNDHTIITKITYSGKLIDMGQPFLYCFRAHKIMGNSMRTSPPPFVIIKGTMNATGTTHNCSGKIYVGGFKGSAPKLSSVIPYDEWIEFYFCGHKREVKCKWWSYQKVSHHLPISAIFSSARDFPLKTYEGSRSHGIFSATLIQLNVNGQYQFGLNKNIILHHPATSLQNKFTLYDECRRSPLQIIAPLSYPTLYRARFASDYMGPMGPIVICDANGRLRLNNHKLRIIPSLQQESQNAVNVLLMQTGLGALDAQTIEPEQIVAKLRSNTLIQLEENAKTGKLLTDDIRLPMIAYYEVPFYHQNGSLENTLMPFIQVPKSFINPRVKDGAGALLALEDIRVEGDTANATIRLTAHLEAGNKIVFKNLASLSQETGTVDEYVAVEDTVTNRTFGMKSSKTSIRYVLKRHIQAGNTTTAKSIEYHNIQNLNFIRAILNVGSHGIKATNIGNITETGIATTEIKTVHGKTSNRVTSIKGTHHVATYIIHPTLINSNAGINFQSVTQMWKTLQANAKEKIALTADDMMFEPMIVTDDITPKYGKTKGICSFATETNEKTIPICLISTGSEITIQAYHQVKGTAPQMTAAEDVTIKGSQGVFLDVLKLKSHLLTRTKGFSGLRHINQKQQETHQRAIRPHIYAGKSIQVHSDSGNVTLAAPILFAIDKIKLTADNGIITFNESILEHDITTKQFSISLEFFGSEAIQCAMQKNYRDAALKIAEEFPLFKHMSDFFKTCQSKNKDTASLLTDGLKALYSTYKAYEALSNAKNLGEFIKNQISKEVAVRFGQNKFKLSWTKVAVPWLQAGEICLRGKEIIAVGLQAEYQNLQMLANNIQFRPAQEKETSNQTSSGLTLGVNMGSSNLSLGVDGSKVSGEKTRNVYSHLRGTNTILLANNKISLKGVCIETLNAMAEAEEMDIETLQDITKSKQTQGCINTGGSFSYGNSFSNERWASEQAGIHAKSTLLLRIKKQLSLIGAKLNLDNSAIPIKVVDNANNQLSFYEYSMPQGTNNDVFLCLNISRAETAKKLLAASDKPEYRALIAPEIEIAIFSEGNEALPSEMQTHELETLKKKFIETEAYLCDIINYHNKQSNEPGRQNSHHAGSHSEPNNNRVSNNIINSANNGNIIYTFNELLSKVDLSDRINLNKAAEDLEKCRNEIHHYASAQSTYEAFVKYYIDKPGNFIGYLDPIDNYYLSSSIDAIAKVNNLNVRVWLKSDNNQLKLAHSYIFDESLPIINLHHTHNQTHFNLLDTKKGILNAPIITAQEVKDTKSQHEFNISACVPSAAIDISIGVKEKLNAETTNKLSNPTPSVRPKSDSIAQAITQLKSSNHITAEFHHKTSEENRVNYAYCSSAIIASGNSGTITTAGNEVPGLHRSGSVQSQTTINKSHVGSFIVSADPLLMLKAAKETAANRLNQIKNNIHPVEVLSTNKNITQATASKEPNIGSANNNTSNKATLNKTANKVLAGKIPKITGTKVKPISNNYNVPNKAHNTNDPNTSKALLGLIGKYSLKVLSAAGKKLNELTKKYPEATMVATVIPQTKELLEQLILFSTAKAMDQEKELKKTITDIHQNLEKALPEIKSYCVQKCNEYNLNKDEIAGVATLFAFAGHIITRKGKVIGLSKKTKQNIKTFLKNPDIQHCHLRDPKLWQETKHLKYERAPYHGKKDNSIKSKSPENGQEGLYNSVTFKSTSERRVGYDYMTGEFVVFDKTNSGAYHGHVKIWEKLDPEQKQSLIKIFGFSSKGKLNLK